MENNNLGDFIRNKLSKANSKESWSNPDPKVDQSVLNTITQTRSTAIWSRKWVWIGSGAVLLFLFLGGVLYQQNKEIDVLKQALNSKSNPVENNTQNTEKRPPKDQLSATLLQKTTLLSKEKSELEKVNEILKQENKNLRMNRAIQHSKTQEGQAPVSIPPEKTTRAIDLINTQNHVRVDEIAELKKERDELKTQNERLSESLEKKGEENESLKDSLIALNLNNIDTVAPIAQISSSEMQPIEKLKRFSVAYDFSKNYWDAPIQRSFEDHGVQSEKDGFTKVSSTVNGLTFGYAPRTNIRLVTGLRVSKFELYSAYDLALSYSSNNEYLGQNGNVVNRFNLTTDTPFSSTENESLVSFDPGLTPQEGDFIGCYNSLFLSFNEYQIPLGVEYLLRANKTRFFFQGGLQLNLLTMDDYLHNTYLYDDEFELLNSESTSLETQRLENQFNMSLYGALGIEQSIFKNFYLRGSFNFSRNFLKRHNNELNPSYNSNTLRFGFGYRF